MSTKCILPKVSTSDCVANQAVNTTITGTQSLSSGQGITGSSIITIIARVSLSAGATVILETGFEAKSGSVFLADIGGSL